METWRAGKIWRAKRGHQDQERVGGGGGWRKGTRKTMERAYIDFSAARESDQARALSTPPESDVTATERCVVFSTGNRRCVCVHPLLHESLHAHTRAHACPHTRANVPTHIYTYHIIYTLTNLLVAWSAIASSCWSGTRRDTCRVSCPRAYYQRRVIGTELAYTRTCIRDVRTARMHHRSCCSAFIMVLLLLYYYCTGAAVMDGCVHSRLAASSTPRSRLLLQSSGLHETNTDICRSARIVRFICIILYLLTNILWFTCCCTTVALPSVRGIFFLVIVFSFGTCVPKAVQTSNRTNNYGTHALVVARTSVSALYLFRAAAVVPPLLQGRCCRKP